MGGESSRSLAASVVAAAVVLLPIKLSIEKDLALDEECMTAFGDAELRSAEPRSVPPLHESGE